MPRSETRHSPELFEDLDARIPPLNADRLPRIGVYFTPRPTELLVTIRFDVKVTPRDALHENIDAAIAHAHKRLGEQLGIEGGDGE